MNILRWVGAVLVAVILLIVFNALLFPLVFPDGLAEHFANARDPQLVAYHVLAFAGTGFLLVSVSAVSQRPTAWRGLGLGALLGLLVSLPEHLHLYAMTTATAARQFVPVPWTAATWALTTAAVGWILARWAPPASSPGAATAQSAPSGPGARQ